MELGHFTYHKNGIDKGGVLGTLFYDGKTVTFIKSKNQFGNQKLSPLIFIIAKIVIACTKEKELFSLPVSDISFYRYLPKREVPYKKTSIMEAKAAELTLETNEKQEYVFSYYPLAPQEPVEIFVGQLSENIKERP